MKGICIRVLDETKLRGELGGAYREAKSYNEICYASEFTIGNDPTVGQILFVSDTHEMAVEWQDEVYWSEKSSLSGALAAIREMLAERNQTC